MSGDMRHAHVPRHVNGSGNKLLATKRKKTKTNYPTKKAKKENRIFESCGGDVYRGVWGEMGGDAAI